MRIGGLVMRLIPTIRSDDAGVTLVEIGVAMMLGSLVAALMMVWLAAGVGSETSHRSYDEALADLRHVTDQLSREIRSSSGVTSASPSTVSFWLDGDRDGVVDTGETITWAIDGESVVRSTDDAVSAAVLATSVSDLYSVFEYDAEDPASITRVTITLATLAYTRAGDDRLIHSADVYLRNR